MSAKILLATDGSSHAEEVLKYARDLALRDGAQVIVVHAFAPAPSYMGESWGGSGHPHPNPCPLSLSSVGTGVGPPTRGRR